MAAADVQERSSQHVDYRVVDCGFSPHLSFGTRRGDHGTAHIEFKNNIDLDVTRGPRIRYDLGPGYCINAILKKQLSFISATWFYMERSGIYCINGDFKLDDLVGYLKAGENFANNPVKTIFTPGFLSPYQSAFHAVMVDCAKIIRENLEKGMLKEVPLDPKFNYLVL